MSESFNFKQWVLQQNGPYTISQQDEDHIHLETEYGLSEVNFYHLDGEDEITQKDIAKNLGISRSYVSRIEKRALTKLLREFIKNKDN